MTVSLPEQIRRILTIRLDNIGDVVMTGPALRALKQAYPGSHLTLMASPAGSQVAPLLPWVDDVITWRAVWQDIATNVAVVPEKEYELVALLEQKQFDAAFIFTSFSQSPHPPAFSCYLARIPIRVGQSKEFGGGLLTHWVRPPEDSGYQVERNLHLLREVGVQVSSDQMELQTPLEDRHRAEAILESAGIGSGQGFIALAPGASAAARRYDEARFAQAAQQLAAQSGLPVVLIGSQREVGRFPTLEALAGVHAGITSLIGQTSVAEMAAIIQRSALLICNNSGSMHMATAFHRPMVILYSGTEHFEQWLPKSGTMRILNRPTPCTPCHKFSCPYHLECLDVPAEEVVMHALDLLQTSAESQTTWPMQVRASSGGKQ